MTYLGPCRPDLKQVDQMEKLELHNVDGEIHQPLLEVLAPECLRWGLDPSSPAPTLTLGVLGQR